jgi:hypothetical protein
VQVIHLDPMRSTDLARNLARSDPENDETRLIKRVLEAPLPGFEPGFPD